LSVRDGAGISGAKFLFKKELRNHESGESNEWKKEIPEN
jgi:hypothetical protein